LLAFVAAERREFDGMLRKADRVTKLDWPIRFARMAWVNGEPIVLVANGPGPKLAGWALEIARKHQELRGLVSTGFCGALNPALEPCDIFVATEVLTPSQDREVVVAQPLAYARGSVTRGSVRTGKLLSIDRVVTTASEKAQLHRSGADAVEMEAAAVAAKASEWNLRFFCVRVVTDTAAESFPLDFNRMRDAEGRFSRIKILTAALRRPGSVLPGLVKLNKRCKDASHALGDFIVNASF
jgi:adenosylhomocysteine nucleosidase